MHAFTPAPPARLSSHRLRVRRTRVACSATASFADLRAAIEGINALPPSQREDASKEAAVAVRKSLAGLKARGCGPLVPSPESPQRPLAQPLALAFLLRPARRAPAPASARRAGAARARGPA